MGSRREIDDAIPANLHENVVASMRPRTISTVQRVRRLARRDRDYCRAYPGLEEGEDIQSKIIETMKEWEARRNILDMQPGFVEEQLQNESSGRSAWKTTSSAFVVLLEPRVRAGEGVWCTCAS